MSARDSLREKYRTVALLPHKDFIIPEYHFMLSSRDEIEKEKEKNVIGNHYVINKVSKMLTDRPGDKEVNRQRDEVKRIMRKEEARRIIQANERKRLPSSFLMPYGKYQGKSLEEIYDDDPSYLKWCAENFEDEQIKGKIIDFLEG